ncbi:hypothetical protein PUNSTDRAFT_40812 [Punctularia strigosozonata HHB-11173 SS5]|uniref:uncharacterized protein n=1 Tax=Punctularia strigosozonata (strain HHB-11173) TaxID=741275 RepID=UPI0004416D6B|nr:uncharacterized protein PUNSTDRAFT_40812 [Punctularia strigosozonata HHB-11173 SS5]EIN13105.1 hypothetical protein PUNSTDRAFT_40812 [Punctularia strigosozonata HHB-11173 SS5]
MTLSHRQTSRQPSPNPTPHEEGQRYAINGMPLQQSSFYASSRDLYQPSSLLKKDRSSGAWRASTCNTWLRAYPSTRQILCIVAIAVQIITSLAGANASDKGLLDAAIILANCAFACAAAAAAILLLAPERVDKIETGLLIGVGMVCTPMALMFVVCATSPVAVIVVVGVIVCLGFLLVSAIMFLRTA